ncbi:hypothetical protein [Streptomyces sp. 135]|uniref:hypothetical protein n=1 Tax=Streptomyces sp. 135 TaxID=2838850 RepID=UPI001CBC6732|nr:hypothetical protein [Streptomyces sp. 135]
MTTPDQTDADATAQNDEPQTATPESATAGPEGTMPSEGPKGAEGPTPAARARRARIAAAGLLMAAAAVVLALRLASRSSVLVVGVYGLLLILCGVVIELSRRGRTRLGTWLLAAGLAAALVMDGAVLS